MTRICRLTRRSRIRLGCTTTGSGAKTTLLMRFRPSRTTTRQRTYRHVVRIIRKLSLSVSDLCPAPVWVVMSVLTGRGLLTLLTGSACLACGFAGAILAFGGGLGPPGHVADLDRAGVGAARGRLVFSGQSFPGPTPPPGALGPDCASPWRCCRRAPAISEPSSREHAPWLPCPLTSACPAPPGQARSRWSRAD
jgi:hypothetical protein